MPINSRGLGMVEVPADSVEAMAASTTLADLAGLLGEMRRDILALQERMARLEAEGANEGGIVAWLSDLETRMGSHTHEYAAITNKPATFPPDTHGNAAHSETYITGVTWEAVTGKPSTFTPAAHANEAHTPDYATQSQVDQMRSTYNSHTHSETGTTTGGPSASM